MDKSKSLKILQYMLGFLFWIYVPIKLFILDIDLLFIRIVIPELIWIVEWKFVFISLIVMVFILLFGVKEFTKTLLFILFYPLIFPSVKIFNYFKKNSSIAIKFLQRNYFPILVFITNYLANIYKHFRFRLMVTYAFILCLFITYNTNKPVVYTICGWVLFLYILIHYSYRIYIATKPSPFFNKILSIFDNEGGKTNESYFTKIKRYEDAAVFSFLLVKGKEFLQQIKTTPYLILYFTLSLIYSIVLSIIILGSLHYILYKLDDISYTISNYHMYLFYLLGLNSLLSIDTNLIIPKGELSNLLVTFGGLLKWLLSIIYGVFLFNILKNHYNYTLDQILNRFENEEDKIKLLLKEKYDKEIECAVEEIKKSFDPNSPINFNSSKLTEAKLKIRENKYDEAILILGSLEDKRENNSEVFYLMGYLYGEKNNIEKMLINFNKSLAINSQYKSNIEASKKYYWATVFNKGVVNFNKAKNSNSQESSQKFYNMAIDDFNSATLIDPKSVSSYTNLIYAFLNMNRIDDATEVLEKVINIESSTEIIGLLGQIYNEKATNLLNQYETTKRVEDRSKAIELFNKSITILEEGITKFPNNGDILLNLSNAYIGANKIDSAMSIFKAGVEKEPENKYYRYNYGVVLLNLANYLNAEIQFKKAIEIDNNYVNAIYNLAVTYLRWGSHEENEQLNNNVKDKYLLAIKYFEQYLTYNPKEFQIWELLGKIYLKLDMNKESKDAFEKADKHKLVHIKDGST